MTYGDDQASWAGALGQAAARLSADAEASYVAGTLLVAQIDELRNVTGGDVPPPLVPAVQPGEDLRGVRDRLTRLTRDHDGFLSPDRLVPDADASSRLASVCDQLLRRPGVDR
jgi:hypothetical protein